MMANLQLRRERDAQKILRKRPNAGRPNNEHYDKHITDFLDTHKKGISYRAFKVWYYERVKQGLIAAPRSEKEKFLSKTTYHNRLNIIKENLQKA